MFKPLLASGLALIFILPGLSAAQSAASVIPAAPAQTSPPPAFRSAMDAYKSYTEESTVNWKQANDTTAQIGGWSAYAKEASDSGPVSKAPAVPPKDLPVKP